MPCGSWEARGQPGWEQDSACTLVLAVPATLSEQPATPPTGLRAAAGPVAGQGEGGRVCAGGRNAIVLLGTDTSKR